jgi:NAD(P)-dependent dehydrogenase (short-subunit alcohol dehydrogenase family)
MADRGFAGRFDLDGRVCLVTGGAGILGTRICRALAECGAAVAVADIDGDTAAKLATEIASETNAKAIGLSCDVTDSNSVADAVDRTVAAMGGIDVLHNNAATKTTDPAAFFEPFETFALEAWREIMAVNIDGMFLVAQAAGKQMIAQGRGGCIIQTASIYGVVGPDERLYEGSEYMGRAINTPAVYSTSKAAVIGLTRHLATIWGKHGIRVNTVTPGGVSSGQNETFERAYGARTPLGRMATKDDIAGAVVYLASDASSYVTGQNLIVDGGWTAW